MVGKAAGDNRKGRSCGWARAAILSSVIFRCSIDFDKNFPMKPPGHLRVKLTHELKSPDSCFTKPIDSDEPAAGRLDRIPRDAAGEGGSACGRVPRSCVATRVYGSAGRSRSLLHATRCVLPARTAWLRRGASAARSHPANAAATLYPDLRGLECLLSLRRCLLPTGPRRLCGGRCAT